MVHPDTVARLKAVVGPRGFLETEADKAAYLSDWRRLYTGTTALVLRPCTTSEVAAIVGLCAEAGIGVVPQGGNTGMMGGAVPGRGGDEIVLSLARLNRIRDVDPINNTMTVEAGCVLADIQSAATRADRLFPLSLAAEGSCQIGGNLSTNAGGTAVLRYGNARDLVLGLEVVLPNGQIWNGLRGLRKDNTGYDLKQLYLGAEGTLGIITAAVLELYALPAETCTALVAVTGPEAATRLLASLRSASGDAVSTFEYMHRACLDLVFALIPGVADPFAQRYDHYALVALTSGRRAANLQALVEESLAEAYEQHWVSNAVIALSEAQAQALWRVRDSIPEANNQAGGCLRHDVSVPVARIPELLEEGTRLVRALVPGGRVTPFGHLGDGNIHFNVVRPPDMDSATFLAYKDELTPRIHDLAVALEGSFSAEHGIGQLKKPELERYRSPVELELMRTLKRALDPRGIMNPGKVV